MANLKERITKTKAEIALRKSHGIITHAAEIAGCSRMTLYEKIKKYNLQHVIDEAREQILDRAEHVVFKQLNDGNLTAAFFLLNTLGKSRGYSQKIEADVRDVTFKIVNETNNKNGNHNNGTRN